MAGRSIEATVVAPVAETGGGILLESVSSTAFFWLCNTRGPVVVGVTFCSLGRPFFRGGAPEQTETGNEHDLRVFDVPSYLEVHQQRLHLYHQINRQVVPKSSVGCSLNQLLSLFLVQPFLSLAQAE